jgi:hypothetical protein
MRPTCTPLPVRLALLGAFLLSALILNDCDDATLGSSPPGGAAGAMSIGQGGASMVVTDASSDGRVIEPDGGPGTGGLGGLGGTFCASPCGVAQGGFGGTKGRAGSEGTAGANGAAYIDGSAD